MSFNAAAQASQDNAAAEYMKIVTVRAQKIVDKLGIQDTAKYRRVTMIIAEQYRDLNAIHDERDGKVKEIKAQEIEEKEKKIKMLESEADVKLYNLHCAYIGKLSAELNYEQIDAVKDGMTYGVLPLTYQSHLDMISTLTEEQKRYIYAALAEAREHAMNAESSNKKHGWFGKYKGRINNYLSAQGYDLKKEREAWNERIKEANRKEQ
jgi:hypothetical protein